MGKKATLSVVIPVYNEEEDLPRNIPILHQFLKDSMNSYDWEIIIADNGPSKDMTGEVGKELEKKLKNVRYVLIPRPGRGNALKEIWISSRAGLLCYMDVY